MVSSIDNPVEGSPTIHQNAQISRIDLSENSVFKYQLNSETNGVYVMVIEGGINVDTKDLSKRDAISIEQTKDFEIKSTKNTELLFIEVPLKF